MSAQFPEKDGWIWRNGEFIPWMDARIHVMSHVVHYGSSVFEGIRCYRTPQGPAVLRLQDHLRRFTDSARIYRMELGYSQEKLEEVSLELIRRNQLDECYVRPLAIRGYGAPGLNPSLSPVDTYVICWPWGAYLGADALSKGVDVCVSSWQRPAPNTYPTLAKAGGNYLNAQLMKMEAVANGYAEAIALNTLGMVSEGSGQNIFLVRKGVLITPSVDGAMLPGITRDCILTLAREIGIPVQVEDVPREALYIADEMFFTGTAAEVSPIRSVDRIPVGEGEPGPIARRLQGELMGLAHGERPDPYGWLTSVAPVEGTNRRAREARVTG
ncbi:MAG: branched-chain amino acid transaminase [Gemmatimonadetes bacterium]|nr:branched-chain amino acid transaminase [Gemmatimonadota bacterium]